MAAHSTVTLPTRRWAIECERLQWVESRRSKRLYSYTLYHREPRHTVLVIYSPSGDILTSALLADNHRRHILEVVKNLSLPDCWIGAGFIRDFVWDLLGDRHESTIENDVDVIWFDAGRAHPDVDTDIEQRLNAIEPGIAWSVKNQARMHARNGDAPYASCNHAMMFWPETVTAVAARLTGSGDIEVLAPYGLDDLFQGFIRPTPRFENEKRDVFDNRYRAKRWLEKWPFLRVAAG